VVITHLVDTSVLTRGNIPAVLEALKRIGTARCVMTDFEIGFSGSNAREWDALQGGLTIHPLVPIALPEFQRALTVQRLLADNGLKGRKIPDLLIAAAAEHAGLTVLHYDKDFELISSVTGQPNEWVVERGSID
jgi:predicted nucleic acid-binding protein